MKKLSFMAISIGKILTCPTYPSFNVQEIWASYTSECESQNPLNAAFILQSFKTLPLV
jgi:hypothetical protein